LDHIQEEWANYPDRDRWQNDTPLSAQGFDTARETALTLKSEAQKMGRKFSLIVSSPYLRCAQTACAIAEELNLKIHFDLDLGEIFDDVAMKGHVDGIRQHRPPLELEKILAERFPTVKFHKNEQNLIQISGKPQVYPEKISVARMRYVVKIDKLLKRAAGDRVSIIIVTHGDAVSALLGMMLENEIVTKVPFCGYAMGHRKVKIPRGADSKVKTDLIPTFEPRSQWTLIRHPQIETSQASQSHLDKRDKSLKQIVDDNEVLRGNSFRPSYTLVDDDVDQGRAEHHQVVTDALKGYHGSVEEKTSILQRAMSNEFLNAGRISVPLHGHQQDQARNQPGNSTPQFLGIEPTEPRRGEGDDLPLTPTRKKPCAALAKCLCHVFS
jgi:broad specificity phosphatase PhoE